MAGRLILSAIFSLCVLSGCEDKNKIVPVTYSWDDATIYEAENGVLTGDVMVSSDLEGYSGEGYVDHFENEGDSLSLTIHIEENGFYDLNFISASNGADYKENYLAIDGEIVGTISVNNNTFTDSIYERMYLTKGDHTVTVSKYWGWISVDSLKVKQSDELDPEMYNVNSTLCNSEASENTKKLYAYMCDIYGDKILSGQYSDNMYGPENVAIQRVTGHFPAVLGLDYTDYTPSMVLNGATCEATENAIDYWNQGGIVTITWKWNVPIKYQTGDWDKAYYEDQTNIDLEKILAGNDEEGYKLLIEDIDAIAEQLKILQEADVPVLWRPLPEASAGWYWWGAQSSEQYIELYKLLYDRLTNYHGLNNLIWIWNGQDSAWYPGDECVDIISWDIYSGEHIYNSNASVFLEAAECSTGNKMIVLTENGCVFDSELAFRDGATWGFFCTWSGEYVIKEGTVNEYNSRYTEESVLKRVYGDNRVVTREDLPDIKTYGEK